MSLVPADYSRVLGVWFCMEEWIQELQVICIITNREFRGVTQCSFILIWRVRLTLVLRMYWPFGISFAICILTISYMRVVFVLSSYRDYLGLFTGNSKVSPVYDEVSQTATGFPVVNSAVSWIVDVALANSNVHRHISNVM